MCNEVTDLRRDTDRAHAKTIKERKKKTAQEAVEAHALREDHGRVHAEHARLKTHYATLYADGIDNQGCRDGRRGGECSRG